MWSQVTINILQHLDYHLILKTTVLGGTLQNQLKPREIIDLDQGHPVCK